LIPLLSRQQLKVQPDKPIIAYFLNILIFNGLKIQYIATLLGTKIWHFLNPGIYSLKNDYRLSTTSKLYLLVPRIINKFL